MTGSFTVAGLIVKRRVDDITKTESWMGNDVPIGARVFMQDLEQSLMLDHCTRGDGWSEDHRAPLMEDGEFLIACRRWTDDEGRTMFRAQFWYPEASKARRK